MTHRNAQGGARRWVLVANPCPPQSRGFLLAGVAACPGSGDDTGREGARGEDVAAEKDRTSASVVVGDGRRARTSQGTS